MNAFNSTFTEFCAGNGDLDRVIAALERDLQQDRRSRSSNLSLIEFAWRTGRIDADSYATLKEICDQGMAGSINTGPRTGSRAAVPVSSPSDLNNDDTRQRPSDISAASTEARADTGGTRLQSQPRASGSHPSGWMTNPSQWDDDGAKPLSPGTLLKERFVLEEVLGRGGMGTVFRAKDLRKEEAQDRFPYVAVKILNEDFRKHPDSLKALQREARKAQALAHPNIVAVYDFDRDGPLVYLVMELLDGVSLEKLIKDSSRRGLPHVEALRIVLGLGAALAHAHEKGVVHCDFKPANAFRCRDGSIKVYDFGIARAIAQRNTRSGTTTRFDAGTLGAHTPGYASCELELGLPPDPRDDVFALACVAYELFSGKHPYDHTSAVEAERSGMKFEPIEGLDRRTWRALEHGLAFARKNRTPTIKAFIDELSPRRHTEIMIAAGAAAAGVAAIGAILWFSLSPRSPEKPIASEGAQTATAAVASPPPLAQSTRPAVDAGRQAVSPKPNRNQGAPSVAGTANVTPQEGQRANPVESPATPSDATDQGPNAATASSAKSDEALQAASAEVLKKNLIANAQTNAISNALDALQALEARLPANDPFLVEEAPRYIGKAYQRLANRAFGNGNFASAALLYNDALVRLPNDPELQASKEQVARVQTLAQVLEAESGISADAIQQRLNEIREAGDPQTYSAVRDSLADVYATRIRKELEADPSLAAANLSVARAVFAGVPSIDAIKAEPVAAE